MLHILYLINKPVKLISSVAAWQNYSEPGAQNNVGINININEGTPPWTEQMSMQNSGNLADTSELMLITRSGVTSSYN